MQGLHKFLLFHLLTCLGRTGHGSGIISGENVRDNSMLYMVSVQDNRRHVCGGFFVSDKFVITAARCKELNPTVVFFGTHTLTDALKYEYIEETYKHGGIMILELSRKVELDNSVQTIPLPKSEISIKENAQCQVAGWSKISTHGKTVEQLTMVDVHVINPQICKKERPNLPANVTCAVAYGKNKGFCQGDPGGPLVCNGIAVGVASDNGKFNCDHPDVPNVYADISKYIQWISSIIDVKR
ncbi:hypothetical protein Q5P01_016192 [Channa striata]|uniref:Peptidase S1 domain-containing protein n=1 Tax=Channa striata TaxID=64152 RepID=A0AA88SLB9_CHASR|nr:hypothetical protein Q5P01_016192 [Channa striata]